MHKEELSEAKFTPYNVKKDSTACISCSNSLRNNGKYTFYFNN
jgi:hypothetical protein